MKRNTVNTRADRAKLLADVNLLAVFGIGAPVSDPGVRRGAKNHSESVE